MVSFISFVFAATINKLPLTKRERGFISAFLPTAAPADKGLGRCDHCHIFNDWLNEFPISDSHRKDQDCFLPAAKRHGLVEVFVVVLLGKTFFWVNFVVVLLGKTIFCFYDNFSCFLLEILFLYIVCILKDANCKPGLKYILKCLV